MARSKRRDRAKRVRVLKLKPDTVFFQDTQGLLNVCGNHGTGVLQHQYYELMRRLAKHMDGTRSIDSLADDTQVRNAVSQLVHWLIDRGFAYEAELDGIEDSPTASAAVDLLAGIAGSGAAIRNRTLSEANVRVEGSSRFVLTCIQALASVGFRSVWAQHDRRVESRIASYSLDWRNLRLPCRVRWWTEREVPDQADAVFVESGSYAALERETTRSPAARIYFLAIRGRIGVAGALGCWQAEASLREAWAVAADVHSAALTRDDGDWTSWWGGCSLGILVGHLVLDCLCALTIRHESSPRVQCRVVALDVFERSLREIHCCGSVGTPG